MATDNIPNPLWRRDESLKEAGALLARLPSGIRVVSFDFFDTLVARLCAEPSDLFIEVGRRLTSRGLFQRPFTPMEFHSARLAADTTARKNAVRLNQFPEIKLADIYVELKNVVTDVAAACQLEFDVERQYIFLNPATISLAQYAKAIGYKVAIVSDTYFTVTQLQQLLRENGMPAGLFDMTFASCERGKAKWNGQLYHDLFLHFDIAPSELMHVGDNEHTDINCARQYGVRAVHYYKTNPLLDRQLLAEKKLRGSDLHPSGALNSIRIHTARRAESNQDAFRDGAFVFGPVLARYADWCVEQFKAANVRTVLALMREGELLGEMVCRAAAISGVNLNLVTCYTSRRATARAALTEATVAATLELLDGSTTVTLHSILRVLELDGEVSRLFEPETLCRPLCTPEHIRHVLQLLFENQRVRELIEAGRRESFSLAFDYLASLIGDETNIGVLDIGWGGSIQRNIARILRRGGRDVRTVGCYLACTRRAGRLTLDGDEVHAFMEQDWNRSTILPELAITASVGSTDGYERDASGAVSPVLGPCDLPPAEQQVRARLLDGILEFQSFWLQLRQQKQYSPETLDDLDRQTASIFYRLLEFPSKPEADRLGVLTHDENYFAGSFSAPLCDKQSPRLLQRGGVQAVFQSARCYWPQGVVARCQPRLVTAMGTGWNDWFALGRIGAWHGTPVGESWLTDEEATALGSLVQTLALQQIVLAGPLVPSLMEVFQFLWDNESKPVEALKNKPGLITVGPVKGGMLRPEFLSRHEQVDGDLNDPETVSALRAKLVPGATVALILPGDLPDSTATGLLHGLAPFLGRDGAVLAACGRFDSNVILETMPLTGALNTWIKDGGRELGFAHWAGSAVLRAQLCNWLIFRRQSSQSVWNNQWTFAATDLALAEPDCSLLVKP